MIKRQKDYIKNINAISLNTIMRNIYKLEDTNINDFKDTKPNKSILELMNIPIQT